MKRLLALSVMAVFGSSVAFAETATLIDFNEVTEDNTSIDFADEAGSSISDAEKALMKSSLAVERWVPVLNASARNRESKRLTQVKSVQSNDLGVNVMGIRARFPEGANNANVTISPPFDIPTMMKADGTKVDDITNSISEPTKFDNKGVVKNVGTIKSVSLNVRGLNYPHSVSLLLADFNNRITEIPMGSVNFDGWKTLTWNNPAYIYDVRQRDLNLKPLYPYSIPLVKLSGIRFHRNGMNVGGDFIAYVKDITMVFDKAVRDTANTDIDDEALWQILASREQIRQRNQMTNFAERLMLDVIEGQLIDSSDTTAPLSDVGASVNTRRNTGAAQ